MWDEYRALRGLDEAGRCRPEALAAVATEALLDVGLEEVELPPLRRVREASLTARPQAPGRCALRSFGALAEALDGETGLLLPLPATLEEVLDQVVRRRPGAEALLWREGRPLAAVYRQGVRLRAEDLVEDGDELDLVLAISGG